MEHKQLLETLILDILNDPHNPMNQYRDSQISHICKCMGLSEVGGFKSQVFQKQFASRFIDHLYQNNEIVPLIEQASTNRKSKQDQIQIKKKPNYDHGLVQIIDDDDDNLKEPKFDVEASFIKTLTSGPNFSGHQFNFNNYVITKSNDQTKASSTKTEKPIESNKKELKNIPELIPKKKIDSLQQQNDIFRKAQQVLEKYEREAIEKGNQIRSKSKERKTRLDIIKKKNGCLDSQSESVDVRVTDREDSSKKIDDAQKQKLIKKINKEKEIKKIEKQAIKKNKLELIKKIKGKEIIEKARKSKKDKQEKEQTISEKEKQDKLKNEKEKQEKLNQEKKERLEIENKEKERIEKEKREQEKRESEKKELQRKEQEQERKEKERKEQERKEIERKEIERKELERKEQAKQQQEKEALEKDKIEKEKELQRIEKEKIEKQKQEKERIEKERLEKEQQEKEFEKQKQRKEIEHTEKERQEKEDKKQRSEKDLEKQASENRNLQLERQRETEAIEIMLEKLLCQQQDNNNNSESNQTRKATAEQRKSSPKNEKSKKKLEKETKKIEKPQCRYCKYVNVKLIELSDGCNICSECLLQDINPFQKILQKIGSMEHRCTGKEGARVSTTFVIENVGNYNLEIRCVVMNKYGLYDLTFPMNCQLQINGVTVKEFKPLQDKSCLKKRKDLPVILNLKDLLRQHNFSRKYTFTCVEHVADQRSRKDEVGAYYYFGFFLVESQNVKQVIDTYKRQDFQPVILDSCKNEIKIDRSRVSLTCQFSLELMQVPGKGEFCQHQQCFCLNSYLEMMSKAEHRRWICPICRKVCFHLVVDKGQQFIIDRIRKLEILVDSVTLDQNGLLEVSEDPISKILLDESITKYQDVIDKEYKSISKMVKNDEDEELLITQNEGKNNNQAIVIDD